MLETLGFRLETLGFRRVWLMNGEDSVWISLCQHECVLV
jgi:hypothetical protein